MADIKAIFRYSPGCSRKITSGYRPAVLIKDDYLTTCVLTFSVNADLSEEIEVCGVFISPEYYPHSLWIGRILESYEGSRLIGYLTVTEIYNPILLK